MKVNTLRELVSIPSVSGQEHDIADYVAEKCQAPGRTVTLLGNNVIVYIPGHDQSKAFILNGHTDTVPPTEQWTEDPYKLRPDSRDDDKLIALGVSDMKSGLAIMVDFAEDAVGLQPPCDTWLLYSSNEETDSSGSIVAAKWLAEETANRYRAIGGLILEPTNAEFVGVGHRGDTLWDITASGRGGHASRDFGEELPAIEKLGQVLAALPELRSDWAKRYSDAVLGNATINVTVIRGGATTNVVPTEASMALNLRVTQQLVPELQSVRANLEHTHGLVITQAWEPNPSICAPDTQIYKAVQSAIPDVPFNAFPGATDQFAFYAHNIP